MRRGWEDVSFAHILFVPYLSPPDVVCLLSTSRDSAKTFDTSEAWKAVIKASYGSAGEGPRGHRSRRERKKKTYWRSGDGAKARLCLLWQQQTSETVAQLQATYSLERRHLEHRWILGQAAAVLGADAYAARRGHSCAHTKLRLWTSNTIVPHWQYQREPVLTNPGVRCDKCKMAPIFGPCFRCAAGCCAKSKLRSQSRTEITEARGRLVRVSTASGGGSVRGGEGYTLCEACFRRRSRFHPPHPFARLLPGFADRRLSMPAIYEAVCGDCSFGSSIMVRPLRMREVQANAASTRGEKSAGGGALWAVPVKVEAAAPLPLSQVKLRIAAANNADNKGLAFSSETWPI